MGLKIASFILSTIICFTAMGGERISFSSFKLRPILEKRVELLRDHQMEFHDREGVSEGLKRELESSDQTLQKQLGSAAITGVKALQRSLQAAPSMRSLNKSFNGFSASTSALPSGVSTEQYQELIDQGLNPVFAKVINVVGPIYQQVGKSQAEGIILRNQKFDLGQMNHSGFTWQKPMGSFAIWVNRQLAPDLFDDQRWIVSDILTLHVDATTFLTNMRDTGMIDISTKQLAAYAGIEFKREYRYMHFANSFSEGLQKDYTNLFLSFLNFYGTNFLKMSDYEFMTKKDYLSFSAGAGAHIPVAQGVSLGAGVMVGQNLLSSVEVQKVGLNDSPRPGELFRINFEKENIKEVEASVALQGDFFSLLRLTLLSYEYHYAFSDSEKIYLSVFQHHVDSIKAGSPIQKELANIFMLRRPDPITIRPLIVSRERRTKENKDSHFAIFLFGQLKKGNVEQIKVEKDGTSKTFFISRYESIKYVKGLFATLANAVTKMFTNSELFQGYKVSRSRELALEYEGSQELNKKDLVQLPEESLSLNIDHEFNAQKTTGFLNKKYKEYAEHFAANFTNVSSQVLKQIKEEKLVGPMKIEVTARINKDGLVYFNSLNQKTIEQETARICGYNLKQVASWRNYPNFGTNSVLAKGQDCFQTITKYYRDYKAELAKSGDMSLWKLREMLIALNRYSDNRADLKVFFGQHNVFYNGNLQARTSDNMVFKTYFKDGVLKSLGVIDDYKRVGEAIRAPASLPAY